MENNDLKSIRTLQTDIQEIEKKGVPLADLVAEAQKRGGFVAEGAEKFSVKKIVIGLAALVVVIGIGLGIFWLFNNKQEENQPVELGPKPILVPDSNLIYIPFSGGPTDFFKSINANPPQELIEALNNRFMLAKFYLTKDWPILIFKIDSYESAFSGMLKWEKSIGKDLEGVFNSGNGGDFSDKEIQNHDTRVSSTLIYSFVNQDYLVIVQDEEPLKEVFHRFSSPQYLNE